MRKQTSLRHNNHRPEKGANNEKNDRMHHFIVYAGICDSLF